MIVIDLVFGLGKNGVSIVKNHWNGHKNVKTCSPPKRASRGFHIYFECTSHPNEDRVNEIKSEHEFISSDDIYLAS
jgi:hypothetical protein